MPFQGMNAGSNPAGVAVFFQRLRAVRLPAVAETTLPKTAAEKVRLFRALFRGRMDVFPRRWENAKLGKSGYAPACGNEWVRGVCEKPKVKCSECPNQACGRRRVHPPCRVSAGHSTGFVSTTTSSIQTSVENLR